MMQDNRREALETWARSQWYGLALAGQVSDQQSLDGQGLVSISDDASFRRYFRFSSSEREVPGFVLVDAPPAREKNEAFIKVSRALLAQGLHCPRVLAADLAQGFLLVTDLGQASYLEVITKDPDRVPGLYRDAVQSLLLMQGVQCDLPVYDEPLLRAEMDLFPTWFLAQQLQLTPSATSSKLLRQVSELLVRNALAQPRVFVHRDYHSRNLMAGEQPGILDFQDALLGPITYDLVSLFKDCYYRFDRQEVLEQVENFRRLASGRLQGIAAEDFLRWFDLMGVQRHLKCVGIFSRLNIRDGKPGYLPDIPRVIAYITEACAIYPELAAFGDWLHATVVPEKLLTLPGGSR